MKKDIEKRDDLVGKEIIFEKKLVLISEAWERTFHNPNVKEWHGKKLLSLAGYYNLRQDENGDTIGDYTRFDVLKDKAEFVSDETP